MTTTTSENNKHIVKQVENESIVETSRDKGEEEVKDNDIKLIRNK